MRKVCTFCGCETDAKNKSCASCGSTQFLNICPNCSNKYEGAFCPSCGVRFEDVVRTCPKCGNKHYNSVCPDCGYDPSVADRKPYLDRTVPVYDKLDMAKRYEMLGYVFGFISIITMNFLFALVAMILARTSITRGNNSNRNRVTIILASIALVLSIIVGTIWMISFAVGGK